ncbi:MAG: thioredoxin family protein [Bacteroidales bacterium]
MIQTLLKLRYKPKENIKSNVSCAIGREGVTKKIISLIFILSSAYFLNAQNFNRTNIDVQRQDTILVGYCTKTIFYTPPYSKWFIPEYNSYSPNNDIITELKDLLSKELHIVVVFGSWCSDSKEQLPHFFKIIDKLNLYDNMIDIIAVDRNKQAPEIDLTMYNIEKVPTFIFYKNKKEIGRIIETPQTTLENEIKLILKK